MPIARWPTRSHRRTAIRPSACAPRDQATIRSRSARRSISRPICRPSRATSRSTAGLKYEIVGDGTHRLFFIGSEITGAPTVSFAALTLSSGKAKGGNTTHGAGAGAGLGGALFIYAGNVTIDDVIFDVNSAEGGSSTNFLSGLHFGGAGGGGMFGTGGARAYDDTPGSYDGGPGGSGGFGGGGGGGADTYQAEGGGGNGGNGGGSNGGFGAVGQTTAEGGGFGGGGGGGSSPGSSHASLAGAAGGFGGGGGGGGGSGGTFNTVDTPGAGGDGGFGAGGGGGGSATLVMSFGAAGGRGGFGGGGASGGAPSPLNYDGGFGGGSGFEGGGGSGASFGGAIFVRAGSVTLTNSTFTNNTTAQTFGGGAAGTAKGGAIFVITNASTNANGNDQGMPATLPVLTGCANTFALNSATNAGATNRDNADVFGADRVGLTLACDDRVFADGFDP